MSRMLPYRGALAAAGAGGLLAAALTGCSGSSGGSAAPTPAPVTTSAAPTCPKPSHTQATNWPSTVPADLPKPPYAHIDDQTTEQGGVHVTRFSTPTSLRESVIFVVTKLPK